MYGCLHKSNKEKVVQSLAVVGFGVPEPKIIVDDTQQLLYHVAWPHGGTPADLYLRCNAGS